MVKITREKFERYEKVRKSGATNMFDVQTVMYLSGLTFDEVLFIMKGYSTIKKGFEEKEGGE
jgi:hypothetical protein